MSEFHFYHPIDVRYGDLDPQGHVNNAKYLTYFEQARVQYWVDLSLFHKDQSFMEIGVIVADIHITYHTPILWGTPLKAGVRISKIGNKSLTIDQNLENAETGEVYAVGTVIVVAFDYAAHKTMSVPQEWREKINAYEHLEV